jgi:hypothetical protein
MAHDRRSGAIVFPARSAPSGPGDETKPEIPRRFEQRAGSAIRACARGS